MKSFHHEDRADHKRNNNGRLLNPCRQLALRVTIHSRNKYILSRRKSTVLRVTGENGKVSWVCRWRRMRMGRVVYRQRRLRSDHTIRTTTTYADPDNKHIESTSDVAIDAFERAKRGLVQPHLELVTSPAEETWPDVVPRFAPTVALNSDQPSICTLLRCNSSFNPTQTFPFWYPCYTSLLHR
ncbi:hypothetical protein BKA70DRAFT_86865 [Coprinopsis sp. MPI-PUGE-AT-0042]|nr:hypothetical protein BKA70DRAFT_86865 [Coprinopsis sp. MPI-PUGE-AT-0042]